MTISFPVFALIHPSCVRRHGKIRACMPAWLSAASWISRLWGGVRIGLQSMAHKHQVGAILKLANRSPLSFDLDQGRARLSPYESFLWSSPSRPDTSSAEEPRSPVPPTGLRRTSPTHSRRITRWPLNAGATMLVHDHRGIQSRSRYKGGEHPDAATGPFRSHVSFAFFVWSF